MRLNKYFNVARVVLFIFLFTFSTALTEEWKTSWTASAQGPYPIGYPTAQPALDAIIKDPEKGASDQSFRLLVRPDIWGREARLRFSNVFGKKPVILDGVYAGLQQIGASLTPGTNRPVTFNFSTAVTIPPGESVWSDGVRLPFYAEAGSRFLYGRKLAVSFHVQGESGPLTWHAKALTTSYLSNPNAGSHGGEEGEASFPHSTASWYFLDAVDVLAPADTRVIVAFGDSLTDGSSSTINGDDRWPDAFSRILHAVHGDRISVVNQGIGGNEVVGPEKYLAKPTPGGPSALDRLDRDILGLSGINAVIWLEGVNDLVKPERTPEEVLEGFKKGVAYLKKKAPNLRVIGSTLTTVLGGKVAGHGAPEQDAKRQRLNQLIREAGLFDALLEFDAIVGDPATGKLKLEFVPDSSVGGSGDWVHPNRAGYLRLAESIDLKSIFP